MSTMRSQDGSSLSVVSDLSWAKKLQGLCPILDIHDTLLLRLLCRHDGMDIQRGYQRWAI